MFDAGCGPAEYLKNGKTFDFPDLSSELCPHCKKAYLKKHGFYERYLIEPEFEDKILIRRYCCDNCVKTVSLLPSFCHPKRTYGIRAIIGILNEYYIKTCVVCLAVTNFFTATGVEFSRQLLRHYRRRMEKNFNSLAKAITDIYVLRKPLGMGTADVNEKVRQLLLHIQHHLDDSLKIFERTRTTYLTPYAI